MKLNVYSDGGARGNPGPAAYAIVVCDGKTVLFEESQYIGSETNNVAEYRGLIAGLGKAIDMKADEAEFTMDSELVIKQMRGEYKVKAPNLIELHRDAVSLASALKKVRFVHVKRSNAMISRADALLNLELDRHQ